MKKLVYGLMLAMFLTAFGSEVSAQKQKTKPRDLFIQKENDESKGKAGAKVRILLKRGNEKDRFVSPNETFYSGDKIKLAFDINFNGYVALLNVGSSGKISMLYPYVGADGKVKPSDKEQMIPANGNDWITFDNQAGTEQITIIFSTNPITSVEQVIQMSGQQTAAATTTTTTTTGAATTGGMGNTTVNVNSTGNGSLIYIATTTEAQAILAELNSRSLNRSKSRDLYVQTVNDDATYIVAESGLISEPTAFVVNLTHKAQKEKK